MWWSDRARGLAALALALSLGGCFQPLYGEAAHPGLVADLQAIEVAPIKDRIGHYLGDDLISSLNGTGSTPTAKYRLTVTVTQKTQTPTVELQINAANAATVVGTAKFSLVQIEPREGRLPGRGDNRRGLRPHAAGVRQSARRARRRNPNRPRARRRDFASRRRGARRQGLSDGGGRSGARRRRVFATRIG